MYLVFDPDQLQAAAEFVFKHNPSCPYWPQPCHSAEEVRQSMLREAERYGKRNLLGLREDPDGNKWMTYIGTGGYTMLFSSDVDEEVHVDFLVDPAVGINRRSWTTMDISQD